MATRIGLIGAGTAAWYHLENFPSIGDAKLVAVVDPSEQAAERVRARFHCARYAEPIEMISKEKPDVVYICTPHFVRGEAEVPCAEAGAHLFLEKPVALTMDVAHRIGKGLQRQSVMVSVGYHWRYNPIIDFAQKALRGSEVAMVLGFWMTQMRKTPWFRERARSGGQLVEQASHLFDLSRYMVGEVEEVSGLAALRCMRDVPGLDIDDVSIVMMKFRNGAIGSISTTLLLSPYMPASSLKGLDLKARKLLNRLNHMTGLGSYLPLMRDYKVGISFFSRDLAVDVEEKQLRLVKAGHCTIRRSQANPYLLEDSAFLQAVRSGDPSSIRCPFDEGVKTLELALAAAKCTSVGAPLRIGDAL